MKNHAINPLAELNHAELQQITDRIIYLRQDVLCMSQQQFADVIGISQTYLSLLENQNKEFNIELIMQIVSSLNVNLNWLIYGIGGNDNIFQARHNKLHQQSEALDALKKAYSLRDTDIEFIQRYISLSDKERSSLSKMSEVMRKLF